MTDNSHEKHQFGVAGGNITENGGRRAIGDPKVKRFFDVMFGGLLLIVLAPLLVLVASILAIKVGPRNIVFVHRRVGRDGVPFGCLKFRTMVLDADRQLSDLLARSPELAEEWHVKQKLRYDPRIIPGIGPLLRKSSLDELPQILNVLRGDMSLVGPRPVTEAELERYGAARALYQKVRPGLTGPWQIGDRSNDSYDHRVKLDMAYATGWTFMGDLRIIARTVVILMCFTRNENAY